MAEPARYVMLPGPDRLFSALRTRCETLNRGADVGGAHAAIIPVLWDGDGARDEMAAQLMRVVAALCDLETVPRHIVLVSPAGATVGNAALRTLLGYVTTHIRGTDTRVNAVVCRDSAAGLTQGAGVVRALTSGLLDDVCGQMLTLNEVAS